MIKTINKLQEKLQDIQLNDDLEVIIAYYNPLTNKTTFFSIDTVMKDYNISGDEKEKLFLYIIQKDNK